MCSFSLPQIPLRVSLSEQRKPTDDVLPVVDVLVSEESDKQAFLLCDRDVSCGEEDKKAQDRDASIRLSRGSTQKGAGRDRD